MDSPVMSAAPAVSAQKPVATKQPLQQVARASGGGRKKVLKTYINDRGEEVTEEVYEEAAPGKVLLSWGSVWRGSVFS